MLPESLQELEEIRRECRAMVTKKALISSGVAVVPLPGIDFFADVRMLMRLMPAINKRFGLSQEQLEEMNPSKKTMMFSIIKKVGNKMIGGVISKELILLLLKKAGIKISAKGAAKFIPVLGQVTAASVSFMAMKIAGNAHVEDCYKIVKEYMKYE